jgi:2-C-methyl-D-erythritol 4-phosphate cytidylyltransferase
MISAIVLAGGAGKRMNSDVSKQYMELAGKPVLHHSIAAFDSHDEIGEIVVVIRKGEEELFESDIFSKQQFRKNIKIVRGGDERSDSVRNGLSVLDPKSEMVLVHDGARPFLDKNIIGNNISGCREHGACVTAVPSKDTVKIVNSSHEIVETPDRNTVFLAQTPQTFKLEIIREALEKVDKEGISVTDDSMAVESLGVKVQVVEGSYENIKLTTPDDMVVGEAIARKRGW